MTAESGHTDLYGPITNYQTRLLQLAGAHGEPDAPLTCDLHVADLLRAEFGSGLGLRAPPGQQDRIVNYDALSYTWGGSETSHTLKCNGVDFDITANLNQALLGLRPPGKDSKYIWVDAICINQIDEREKSSQVPNMYFIYQQAIRVVAWLGGPIEHTLDVLQVAKSVDQMLQDKESRQRQNSPERQSKVDIALVYQTLTELYGRPYFERIWIQQEIFAATHLVFICGQHEFTWARLLAEPSLLLDYYDLRNWVNEKEEQAVAAKKTSQFSFSVWRPMSPKDDIQIPASTAHLLRSVTDLTTAHQRRLGCFSQFSNRTELRKSPELVDTLLYTGVLKATNPRDFVYGILPMSGFRHKQMSLQRWLDTKLEQDITIPVDYSMSMAELLAVTTWAVLMQGGLGLLAKFKLITKDQSGWDSFCSDNDLPSWAIDWRLAARCFTKTAPITKLEQGDHDMHIQYNISEMVDAWNTWGAPAGGRNILERYIPPPLHRQFVGDNRNPRLRANQLIVRGQQVYKYDLEGDIVCYLKGSTRNTAWKLDFKTKSSDILVDVFPFVGAGFDQKDLPKKCAHPKQKSDSLWVPEGGGDAKPPAESLTRCGDHGGLWLLRRHPSRSTHWKLIAILAYTKLEVPVFRQWKYTPEKYTPEGRTQLGVEEPPIRRLRVEPLKLHVDYAAKRTFREYQEYIIV